MLEDITPLILTYNEAPNIERTLSKLTWARDTVVVDSGSTDGTLEMLRSFPQVRIVQRPFDSFAKQCNFGLERISTPWVLSLDADYVLTDSLVAELRELSPAPQTSGYRAAFRYCIHGRPLRGSLYPPRTVLYRRQKAHYRDEGHGHRVQIGGEVKTLHSPILHDDRKPLIRWLQAQDKYMRQEAEMIANSAWKDLGYADRLRKLVVFAPFVVFAYCLLAKRGMLDGKAGLYYAFQRILAEALLSLRLIEEQLRREDR